MGTKAVYLRFITMIVGLAASVASWAEITVGVDSLSGCLQDPDPRRANSHSVSKYFTEFRYGDGIEAYEQTRTRKATYRGPATQALVTRNG